MKADAGPAEARFVWRKAFGAHLVSWLAACHDYYAASARYEELSRLSDVELEHRGLTRTSLGRDVCEGSDEPARR